MTGETSNSLIERCKNILLKPKEEWARIDPEPATVSGLMTGWVVPLAAIGPVAGLIDGRYKMEKWNKEGRGSYGVLLADRFLIEAEGNAPDIGTLKALVSAVDAGKLQGLAG